MTLDLESIELDMDHQSLIDKADVYVQTVRDMITEIGQLRRAVDMTPAQAVETIPAECVVKWLEAKGWTRDENPYWKVPAYRKDCGFCFLPPSTMASHTIRMGETWKEICTVEGITPARLYAELLAMGEE